MKKVLGAVKRYLAQTDLFLMLLGIAASVYGIILIYTATYSFGSLQNVKIQIIAFVLGFAGMIVLSLIDYEILSRFSKYIYILCILFLLSVVVFGTGMEETGNKNWIRFGPIGIQPSELVKIGFIITFSAHLNAVKEHINSIKHVILLAIHMAIPTGIILLQGDTGSALVFLFIFAVMCFSAGLSLWYFAGAGVLSVISLPFVWNMLQPYQQSRILVGFNPELDPSGWGYQAFQSKIAIGSGQLSGNGFLQGMQTQNDILPAKHTDFIFGVAGDEFGFIGCLIIIALLSIYILRCIYVSRVARNDMGSLLAIGVAAMFIFQTFENIGMCLGMLPVIGITLPFFSYGGSSMISVMLATGLVMGVYYRKKRMNF